MTRRSQGAKRITDEYMRSELGRSKPYTLVLFYETPKSNDPAAEKIIWEHGRRNFELRRDGMIDIVGPGVGHDAKVAGFIVFSTDLTRGQWRSWKVTRLSSPGS